MRGVPRIHIRARTHVFVAHFAFVALRLRVRPFLLPRLVDGVDGVDRVDEMDRVDRVDNERGGAVAEP